MEKKLMLFSDLVIEAKTQLKSVPPDKWMFIFQAVVENSDGEIAYGIFTYSKSGGLHMYSPFKIGFCVDQTDIIANGTLKDSDYYEIIGLAPKDSFIAKQYNLA